MIIKLKNKATAIISSEPCAKSVTIYFLFKIGSRNEEPDMYGMAHFLEHMFFKGTCNRPEAKIISSTIDQYGGIFNAFTSRDMTGYYIKLPPKYLEIAIDILSDMILNSIFDKNNIETEKDVVINELKMRLSKPSTKIDEVMNSLLFKNTNLEHSIGGSKKTICKFDRSNIANFIINNYKGSNLIISIAGKIKPSIKHIIKILKNKISSSITNRYKYFIESSVKPSKNPEQYLNFYKKQSRYRYKFIHNKDIEHTFISFAFPTISYNNPLSFVLEIISLILAGNMSSRLFIELREKLGLVYNIEASTEYFIDTGSFTINCSTFNNKDSIYNTVHKITEELSKLKNIYVSEKELKIAINYAINSLDMKQENTNDVALNQACEYIFLNKVLTLQKIKQLYSKITPNMVMKTIKKFFIKSKCNLVILSPIIINKINIKL